VDRPLTRNTDGLAAELPENIFDPFDLRISSIVSLAAEHGSFDMAARNAYNRHSPRNADDRGWQADVARSISFFANASTIAGPVPKSFHEMSAAIPAQRFLSAMRSMAVW